MAIEYLRDIKLLSQLNSFKNEERNHKPWFKFHLEVIFLIVFTIFMWNFTKISKVYYWCLFKYHEISTFQWISVFTYSTKVKKEMQTVFKIQCKTV